MLEFCLFVIILAGLISFSIRLHVFNQSFEVQNRAYDNFKTLKARMTVKEINEKLGRKGHLVLKIGYPLKYRWYFGDSVVVEDERGFIVPFKKFSNDIENMRKYKLKRSSAYIEMDFVDGYNVGGVAIGLN